MHDPYQLPHTSSGGRGLCSQASLGSDCTLSSEEGDSGLVRSCELMLDEQQSLLNSIGLSLEGAAKLISLAGRPALLSTLKRAGLSNLGERQRLANAVTRALKAGEVSGESLVPDLVEWLSNDDKPLSWHLQACHASALGDADALRSLLESAEPEMISRSGTDALVAAAKKGHTTCVTLLLEARASPISHQGGCDALFAAAENGEADCVSALLASGAPVDFVGKDGQTALLAACASGECVIVRLLLSAQAATTSGSPEGLLPLSLAAKRGEAEMVKELISAQASVTQPTALPGIPCCFP